MCYGNRCFKVLLVISTLLLVLLFIAACTSEEKVGKLISYRASFSAEDMATGEVEDLYVPGIFIVEVEDGTEVEIVINDSLLDTLRWHDMVVIEPIEPVEFEFPPGSTTLVEWEITGLAD